MLGPPQLGHVVEDYYIGHTHVIICDDYCLKSKEETDKLVGEILRDAYEAIVGAQRKAQD